jgi:hypothetical protein
MGEAWGVGGWLPGDTNVASVVVVAVTPHPRPLGCARRPLRSPLSLPAARAPPTGRGEMRRARKSPSPAKAGEGLGRGSERPGRMQYDYQATGLAMRDFDSLASCSISSVNRRR